MYNMWSKLLLLGCISLVTKFIYTHGATAKSKSTEVENTIVQHSNIFDYGLKEMNFICMKAYLAALRFIEANPTRCREYLDVNFDKLNSKNTNLNEVDELRSSQQVTTAVIQKQYEDKYEKDHRVTNSVVTFIAKIFKGFVSKNMKDFQNGKRTPTIEDYVKTSVDYVKDIFYKTKSSPLVEDDVTKLHKHSMALETIWHLCRLVSHSSEDESDGIYERVVDKFFGKIPHLTSKQLPGVDTMKEQWEIFRDHQILAYESDKAQQLPKLSDYLLVCGDLCYEYNKSEIKGPVQFDVVYEQQKNQLVSGAFRTGGVVKQENNLKRKFFMSEHETGKIDDKIAHNFMKWLMGLLIPHLDLKTMMPAKSTDSTLLFLDILNKSELDFCFIGALINYFSLLNKYTIHYMQHVKATPDKYYEVLNGNDRPTLAIMHPFDLFSMCVGSKLKESASKEQTEVLFRSFGTLLTDFDNALASEFWATYQLTDGTTASSAGMTTRGGKFAYPIEIMPDGEGRFVARKMKASKDLRRRNAVMRRTVPQSAPTTQSLNEHATAARSGTQLELDTSGLPDDGDHSEASNIDEHTQVHRMGTRPKMSTRQPRTEMRAR